MKSNMRLLKRQEWETITFDNVHILRTQKIELSLRNGLRSIKKPVRKNLLKLRTWEAIILILLDIAYFQVKPKLQQKSLFGERLKDFEQESKALDWALENM